MTTTTADSVIRSWFDQVWNQGNESAIDTFMHPSAVAHGLPGGPCCGPAGFRPVFDTFRGAFSDLRIDVEQTIADGDKVAAYCHVTGTHDGHTLGMPPTGQPVDFYGVTITRVVDGTIREGWNCFDFLTMYQQLGTKVP